MPLSEFYRMAAKGKVEASQQKTSTSSTDVSFAPDNELVELVWENGQIMMQGQSSRSRKTPKSTTSNNFPFQSPKFHDKDIKNQSANNLGNYRTVDSVYSDIATSVPSGGRGPSQDEDIVPWFNYPNEDNLQQDLCPDFLPELSGVTVNESPTRKSLSSMDKKDHCDQIVRDSHNVSVHNGVALEQGNASKLPFSRSTQLNSWSLPQGQTSVGSRISDINNDQAPSGLFCQMNMKNQDTGQPKCNSSFLNFSHFSRSAAMARANIQNASAFPTLGLKPLETKPLGEPNLCREDPIMNVTSHNHNLGGSIIKGVPNNEKASEPVGASSSVCSGNSVERASNDPTVNLKRKPCHDTEESECQSEDVEEESVGIKKAASVQGVSGSKRSRAAEVHNLSERRRRDRINEKMRTLQELIPNCNKADKASMLDEAIEYLKTLQLQVQIMSMGAGMYMPPMMLPTGMQHLHTAHLPHFSPMGVGMGMGFGTNMLDMNGGSRGCSMIPMAHMQGARYPSPPISGPTTFQSMARANLPVFGHPSQGLPMSVAGASLVPLSARPPINSGTGMSAFPVGVNVEASNAALNMNSKDLTQNTDSQVTHSADASISVNQQSSQFQATTKEFDQPDLLPKNDQREDANGNSTKENDVVPSREANCD